jgi:hypothetical protein
MDGNQKKSIDGFRRTGVAPKKGPISNSLFSKIWSVSNFFEPCEDETVIQAPYVDNRGFGVYDPLKDKGIDCTVVHAVEVSTQDEERGERKGTASLG